MFNTDLDALKFLQKEGIYEYSNGQLAGPQAWRDLTQEVRDAINYLFDEWDFESYTTKEKT